MTSGHLLSHLLEPKYQKMLNIPPGKIRSPLGAMSMTVVPSTPSRQLLLKNLTSLFTFLPLYRKGIDIQINDIILIAIPFIHAGRYNLLPGKINSCIIFLNVRHSKGSKGEEVRGLLTNICSSDCIIHEHIC